MSDFWENVDRRGPEECWPWLGQILSEGYGRLSHRHTLRRAHHVAWEEECGRPPRGILRNTCGDRACVNPAHWTETTRRVAVREANAAGALQPFSAEEHPRRVLTAELVAAVKEQRAEGLSLRRLADAFGVSVATVRRALGA